MSNTTIKTSANETKKIQVLSRHKTVMSAVMAAGLDLSYNLQEAMRKIQSLDQGDMRGKVIEAYVVKGEKGPEVMYLFKCDIKLLNKFDPFMSVLHDGAFFPVTFGMECEITVHTNLGLPRDCRDTIARCDMTVTTL